MSRSVIENCIQLSKQTVENLLIVVVGNTHEIAKDFTDFESGMSIVSEYYALEHFRNVVDTLRAEGFEVVPYYDEMDFIRDYLTHRLRSDYYKKMIVFNFAQKSIVHGRESLVSPFCEMNNIMYTNDENLNFRFFEMQNDEKRGTE